MKKIQYADNTIVTIPEGPLGISCSGGADSSLLLYILMSYSTDTIHIFTLSNNRKGRANAVVVPKVIERCIQLTGNINVIHHSWYADEQREDTLFDLQRQFLKEGKIKTIFSAITANPPENTKFAAGKGEHVLRNPTITKPEVQLDGYFLIPFANNDKKTIAKIYQELDLMETLFPVTRSCEVTDKIEYYGHCGKCWWCEERHWGFGNV